VSPAVSLLGRLARLQDAVGGAVGRRRADDPAPDDPFRGLYLSDDVIDHLLSEPGAVADRVPVDDCRLNQLSVDFGLSELDVELLLVALAPDVDSRFERFYGYLNDDVTRRRASIGLALELCAASPADAAARGRLAPGAPLLDGGLVTVEDPDRPFLTRALRVPDRVVAHLLGDDRPDAELRGVLAVDRAYPVGDARRLGQALSTGLRLVYLREVPGGAGRALATGALARAGRLPLLLDLSRLAEDSDPVAPVEAIGREIRLRRAGLVAGPVDALGDRAGPVVRALADLPVLVLLVGRIGWDPAWSTAVPLILDVPLADRRDRAALWRSELADAGAAEAGAAEAGAAEAGVAEAGVAGAGVAGAGVAGAGGDAGSDGGLGAGPGVGLDPGLDPAVVTAPYLLAPDQIARASESARVQAAYEGARLSAAHVRQGARAQNAASLERLARRIVPAVGWDDLVLPSSTVDQIRELAARARHRDQVLSDWRMRPGGGRGRGITALFAGDSGTGKTMSAEVIAGELGLDLYAINLATVVDKYVGETEKNLDRLFTEAAGVNGVLLFDEADAIFGKRSEVRDAHDRYANIESAFLLQRMESFDGLAVLATNLRANLDEAFTRRLDAVVDFPVPDSRLRRALWERCLGGRLPRADDLDLDFCASAFQLSGGNIRSATLTAAYLAADAGRPVRMADLIRAVQREYRKLGRLCLESEFGPYAGLVRSEVPA
jgi:hypothetical protein